MEIMNIKQYIKIDETSQEPVYRQLECGIGAWLESLAPGDKLPSERELAKAVGVNRLTLRKALQIFTDSGQIIRKVKGTFVAPANFIKEDAHPFCMSDDFKTSSVVKLRFALFEHLPVQKRYWRKLISAFEAEFNGVEVEILWLPNEINSLGRYQRFIEEKSIDLALLSDKMIEHFVEYGVLKKLDDEVTCRLNSEQYLTSFIERKDFAFTDYTFPIALSMAGIVSGSSLSAEKMRQILSVKEMFEHLLVLGNETSNNLLCATPWNFLTVQGLPEVLSESEIKDDLRGRFEQILKLESVQKKIVWPDTSKRSLLLAEFLQGGSTVFIGSLGSVWQNLNNGNSNDFNFTFVEPWDGRKLTCGINSVGVIADSNRSSEAMELANFLVSEKAQLIIAECGISIPTLSSVSEKTTGLSGRFSVDIWRKIAKSLCTDNSFRGGWYKILTGELMEFSSQVINREISCEEAADRATELIRRKYPERIR
jgi:DNA-binding transcriptional regulator YhcF (GntR family)